MFEKEAKKWVKENSRIEHSASFGEIAVEPSAEKGFQKGAEFGYKLAHEEMNYLNKHWGSEEERKANEWHKLDWEKDFPDVDKLVRVRTRSGAEYICETYSYLPTEDEIGYGSVITQFAELNGDWIDDNEIEYWCYIEPFKEIKEK